MFLLSASKKARSMSKVDLSRTSSRIHITDYIFEGLRLNRWQSLTSVNLGNAEMMQRGTR